jgi:hypothetical protein
MKRWLQAWDVSVAGIVFATFAVFCANDSSSHVRPSDGKTAKDILAQKTAKITKSHFF